MNPNTGEIVCGEEVARMARDENVDMVPVPEEMVIHLNGMTSEQRKIWAAKKYRPSLAELVKAGVALTETQRKAWRKQQAKRRDRVDARDVMKARKKGTLCMECLDPMRQVQGLPGFYTCSFCHGDCYCMGGPDVGCSRCEQMVEAT